MPSAGDAGESIVSAATHWSFASTYCPVSAAARAETRATFRGIGGRLYKLGVLGSRGHGLVVRHMLRRLRKQAERRASGR